MALQPYTSCAVGEAENGLLPGMCALKDRKFQVATLALCDIVDYRMVLNTPSPGDQVTLQFCPA